MKLEPSTQWLYQLDVRQVFDLPQIDLWKTWRSSTSNSRSETEIYLEREPANQRLAAHRSAKRIDWST